MTLEEQSSHINLVRELSLPGGPLDKEGAHATLSNPEWFRADGRPRAGRRALHSRLRAEVAELSGEPGQERKALVLAGPPGAGKGRVADSVLGADRDKYVNVDADEFKKLLLREAISDGSYETWIVPQAVRDLEAEGERFYPLELASLVHEESSMLAVQLREELIDSGSNLIVDTVLASDGSAQRLGELFTSAGYEVTLIDVEVPFEVSADRIEQRWQSAMRDAEAGVTGALGGRWVPSTYARPLFETTHGRSRSQDVASRLAENCVSVMRYERHFTSRAEHEASQREARGAKPVLELRMTRAQIGAPLIDAKLAATLNRAAIARPRPGAQQAPNQGFELS